MGIGDWGLGIGDWGLGIGPNPQSPIPHPQSPFKKIKIFNISGSSLKMQFNYYIILFLNEEIKIKKIKNNFKIFFIGSLFFIFVYKLIIYYVLQY